MPPDARGGPAPGTARRVTAETRAVGAGDGSAAEPLPGRVGTHRQGASTDAAVRRRARVAAWAVRTAELRAPRSPVHPGPPVAAGRAGDSAGPPAASREAAPGDAPAVGRARGRQGSRACRRPGRPGHHREGGLQRERARPGSGVRPGRPHRRRGCSSRVSQPARRVAALRPPPPGAAARRARQRKSGCPTPGSPSRCRRRARRSLPVARAGWGVAGGRGPPPRATSAPAGDRQPAAASLPPGSDASPSWWAHSGASRSGSRPPEGGDPHTPLPMRRRPARGQATGAEREGRPARAAGREPRARRPAGPCSDRPGAPCRWDRRCARRTTANS